MLFHWRPKNAFSSIVFHILTPNLWKRYVEDIFVILDTEKLSDFHIALNSLPWIRKRTVIYRFSIH